MSVKVVQVIKAPVEKVFDLLADHANYQSFMGVKESRLEVEGSPDRNGLGALRYIKAGPAWFRETITHYDRPNRFDYRITEASIPLQHEGGSIRCRAVAGGTEVTWTTDLRVKLPLVGGLLTRVVNRQLEGGIASMLRQTGRRLAA